MVGALGAVFLRSAPELAPHLDQDAVGEPTRLEVALEGEQSLAGFAQVAFEVDGLSGVGVVAPRCAHRHHPHRQPEGDVGGEPGEPVTEVGFRVGDRAAEFADPAEFLAQLVRLVGRTPHLGEAGRVRGQRPEAGEAVEHLVLDWFADRRPEFVAVDAVDRRHRPFRRRDHR